LRRGLDFDPHPASPLVRGRGKNAMTTIYNILKLKERRANLRTVQTPQEILLWSRLRREQLSFKFRRQHSIGGYIADFYCPSKKLVIEIDGSQHFTNKEYDEIRSKYLEGLGIKVIRFTNADINTNINGVIENIIKELNHA
jgi:very-short-patch-repair endonuclease